MDLAAWFAFMTERVERISFTELHLFTASLPTEIYYWQWCGGYIPK